MSDIASIVLGSSIAAIIGIALGVMLPALAMGKAISSALEALARQPESERSIMRTLFIGEDGSGHLNNYLWAYNVDTKLLSKVLSLPAGAESVGLQAVDNLNGFAYVMSGFQHAGDLSYSSTSGAGTLNGKTVPADLMSAIISNWGGINKKSAVGYISGLPLIP